MNVKKQIRRTCPERSKGPGMTKCIVLLLLVLSSANLWCETAQAESAQTSVQQGNKLYNQGEYNEAIKKYDQALIEKSGAVEPKFNKANSYYRLDDLAKALDLYREVATESRDMKLVAKAKYNLGNSYFQQGLKQRDSDLQKALEDLKTSIGCWRQTLDTEPENEKAARNIEVARLIIKDIIDQLNKQKQQQQNQQDQQNQQQQQQQSQPQSGDQEQQQQKLSQQDPNQPQDPNQSQEQQQQQPEQKTVAPDATAQEILDEEQRQRKERQMLRRAGYQKVEKDW